METIKRTKRLISIDLMRGYFLLVIVIDHLGRFPNMLEWVSGRGALWVTAAEGFFFVSGLMLGLTSVRKIADQGFWPIARKMWRRAALLYALAVITTLIFTYISFRLGWEPKGGLTESRDWFTILQQTITLQYAYGWTDFLPRYALFMLVAPVAGYLLYRGMWWAVVWISMLVWAFAGPTNFTLAWQIVFFLGMIAGYYLPRLMAWAESWSPATRQTVYRSAIASSLAALSLSLIFCLVPFILSDYGRFVNPLFSHLSGLVTKPDLELWLRSVNETLGSWLFHHERMGIGRIILFNLYFWTALAVLQKHGHTVSRWVGWIFLPLGKNSLLTYLAHACVIFAVEIFVVRQISIKSNLLHTLLAIGLVWVLVVLISHRSKLWLWLKANLSHNQWLTNPFIHQLSSLSAIIRTQAGSIAKVVALVVPLVALVLLATVLLARLLT